MNLESSCLVYRFRDNTELYEFGVLHHNMRNETGFTRYTDTVFSFIMQHEIANLYFCARWFVDFYVRCIFLCTRLLISRSVKYDFCFPIVLLLLFAYLT